MIIEDFYNLEALMTEEQRFTRDTVRKFVEQKFLPVVARHYEAGTFPVELIPEIGEMGLLGANLPTEYGCAGMDNIAYGLIMQELERGDSGLRSFVSVQGALVMYPIFTFGSEEQKMKYLPKLATGEMIGCFGLTEPDFGSNPSGMITKAKKDGNSYILNGAKMWITNGTMADIAVVWAKTDDGKVKGFLVEKGTPGFSAPEIHHKLSLRCSVTSELIFDDCRIPAENILPNSGGLKSPLMCLSQARYGISWGAIGAALACYEASVKYSLERIQFDKPIASFQLVQDKLAYMLTEITKAQLVSFRLGQLKDEHKVTPEQISLAKKNNVYVALEIARLARDIHGANGITLEYPVMRHLCNLETVKTYEGTHDIHSLVLGQKITGINAFK